MTYAKPVPVPDPDTQPFWEGCQQGKLLLQRCDACSRFRFPPGETCPNCGSDRASWVGSSGRGRVFSWIVVVHPVPREIYAADVPYVVALVDLEEGVRMATNIIGCQPGSIVADMPVQVAFERVSEAVVLPKFRPVPTRRRAD